MGLSDALAKLNHDRFQAFEVRVSDAPRAIESGTIRGDPHERTVAQAQGEQASAWAFDGPAHKARCDAAPHVATKHPHAATQAWAVDTLGKAELEYAQSHVLTLSGLYGCLRPRDAIRPYALRRACQASPG
jgi:hypothetical protein